MNLASKIEIQTTMKFKLTIIAVLFYGINAIAQNFYISASDANADDSNIGSMSEPWRSFAPLNTLLASNTPIDTIFLRCGDIFRDQINVAVAGDFVLSSYGSGNKPVISGADSVVNWIPYGDFYQADFSGAVVNFFVDNKEQIIARFPDAGYYLTVDAATQNYLQDEELTSISATVLNRSQVCVHTAQWCWEKSGIASSAGNRINYSIPTLRVPTADYGYFLYDDTSYLNLGNEWKYDSEAQKLFFKPATGNPNNQMCEASVRPYGILLGDGVSNITINNISFEKQAESGIAILNATNEQIKIVNCYFAGQYRHGVDVKGRHIEISDSYFREVDGIAVFVNGTGFETKIHHNIFRNNGGFRNSGIGTEINLSSIKGAFVDSCNIHHNDIDSAGYCGIAMDGKFNCIERNVIKNAMLLNNDGAALKSYSAASQYNIFRNNFVSKSDGNTEGIPNGYHFITPAIYFDFSVNNCLVQDNTVFDRTQKGIFLNSGTYNNTVTGNIVYGGNYLLDFNGSPAIPTPMTGMTVKKNVLFAKDPDAMILRMVDNTGGYNQGTIDSNYYFQPYNSENYAFLPPSTFYNFDEWQAVSGFDIHTRSSYVDWDYPFSNDTLFMNQTDSVITIELGTIKYLDTDSVVVCGALTLQPYTSKILINTNTFCTTDLPENEISTTVYPNPCTHGFIIETNEGSNVEYFIMNNIGSVVARGILRFGKNKVSVEHLATGMYYIRTSGEHSHTYKLLKN